MLTRAASVNRASIFRGATRVPATRKHVRTTWNLSRRFTAPAKVWVGKYQKHGAPSSVVEILQEEFNSKVSSKQVLVEMMYAPINPADLNMIQGNYGVATQPPAIGGNEGLGRIAQVGSGVTNVKVGDLVVPAQPGFGTWRTHAVCDVSEVQTLPANAKNVAPEYLASLSVNPCTALRLLEDFVDLKEGDVIIQNGANSMVGTSVMQLAAARGIKTINLIRDRGDYANTVERMKAYGGYIVCTDDYIRTHEFRDLISDLPKPKLALNCVGGPVVTDMVRLLDYGGTLVTYGGMSKKPVTIPTSQFIFNNIQSKGFWLTKWLEEHSAQDRMDMFEKLIGLMEQKKFRLWVEKFHISDLDVALERAMSEKRFESRKPMLMMQHDPEGQGKRHAPKGL